MGLFARTKTTDPALTHDAGRKIVLNFGSRSSKEVQEMAAATLEAGGFDAVAAQPKPGEKLPDGTVYAGVSPDTGKAMYAPAADAPLTYTFNEAQKYAKQLDAHGHQDWRVPTKDELNVLFNNRAAIGGFNVTGSPPAAGWYWPASEDADSEWIAWCQRFDDGYRAKANKLHPLSVRCIR